MNSTAMAFIPLLVNALIVAAVVYGIYRLLRRRNDRSENLEIQRLQEEIRQLRSENSALREQVEKMQDRDRI